MRAMGWLVLFGTVMMVVSVKAAPSAEALRALGEYNRTQDGQTCLVLCDGQTLLERYDNGGAPDHLQMLASGSKSFVGVAAVAAVQDKLLNFDDVVSGALSEWKNDPVKSTITYRHLLTLTSGLKATGMGAATHGPSWTELPALPMAGKPGQQYQYGPYQLDTFAYALERKLGGESFQDYLQRRIFAPLGVTVEWRFKCADGHPQVASGAFMTARDWAKFGEMIRLGGVWNGKQILDPALLSECFIGTTQNPAYGLAWWLKRPVSIEQMDKIPVLKRAWGNVVNADWIPSDMVAACGAGNQRLYIIPSQKLVVVRQGKFDRTFSDAEFLSYLLRGKPLEK